MRHFIIINFLLAAVTSPGQIYVDSYRFAPATPTGLLLDNYPGAAAAYSLRKLRTAYTGSAIMVRRSSDGDSLNIGFSGNYLDTAAMKNFCGTSGSDICTVRRWYDQSGNGKDAVQTTDANQPTILRNGVIVYDSGHPSLNFDNTNDAMTVTNTTSITNNSYFIVSKTLAAVSGSDFNYTFSLGNDIPSTRQSLSKWHNATADAEKRYLYDGASARLDGVNSLLIELASMFYPTTTPFVNLYINSTQQTFATIPTGQLSASTNLNLGFLPGGPNPMNGFFFEFILYNSVQSTNRSAIETNINNFYSIY